ncbi:MAG: hypothetical protein COW01_14195 [Bdellovibrionales bacterium CG12_big_fil_rev_8_21_14_0_65_38_15]|nr:MAG: hypothetical protein COW79_17015 [Bdellovibrionales bacterium CG22_combo_CG10-13_8_21_14_all_38_13]PIQ53424.1 MAG: hypothetical protein COW01_14195 [Bdellovibrionales bacterium CG12_big_fil_rev_8_21_14_0_65_38_15]PIR30213.1 MAG: hypothetical protein COV38_05560 [Bdellovibrionales bacterium CG11_big_fil_rev_8_21_14_0_20_38_13]
MNKPIKKFLLFTVSAYLFATTISLVVLYKSSNPTLTFISTENIVYNILNIRDQADYISKADTLSKVATFSKDAPSVSVVTDYNLKKDLVRMGYKSNWFFDLIKNYFFFKIYSPKKSKVNIYLDVPSVYVAQKNNTNFFFFNPLRDSHYYPDSSLTASTLINQINETIRFSKPFFDIKNIDFYFPRLTFGSYTKKYKFRVLKSDSFEFSYKSSEDELMSMGISGLSFFDDWNYLTTTISSTGTFSLSIEYYYDDSCLVQFQNAFTLYDLTAPKPRRFYFSREQVLKNKLKHCNLRELTIKTYSYEDQTISASHNGLIKLKSSR